MNSTISPALAEGSEFEAMYDFVSAPDRDSQRKVDAAGMRLGGGGAVLVRTETTRYWNKALGFGFAQPVTRELIGEVVGFYQAYDVPEAAIQLAPSVIPGDWDEISAQAGLAAGRTVVKLACDVTAALAKAGPQLDPDLRLRPAAPEHAADWSATMMRVFEMTDEADLALGAATVGRPGWHPYAVWAGPQIVATATMHVQGETAQLFGGATLPEYRGRGAQTALIAARAQAAYAAGCRWLVAETGAEAAGNHNSSLWNMRRAGFKTIYKRTNWIWRPAAPSQGQ